MDTAWTLAKEPHERVKWARLQTFETATAAAEALGMKKDTYSAYERDPAASKTIALTHQRAVQFGRRFKVSWLWLLLGEGTPADKITSAQLTPALERIAEALEGADEQSQERAADAVVAFLRRA